VLREQSQDRTGEIGVVTVLKAADGITVMLDDGMVPHVKREDVDKPLEIEPALMLAVSESIASIEKQRFERNGKQSSIGSWWIEVRPCGRILSGAGSDQNLTYLTLRVPSEDSRGGILLHWD
jgi:ribonucleoside-diphosphate reductase alpha chain